MRLLTFALLFLILNSKFLTPVALATVNPLNSPNNKFGVHLIAPTPDESSPAAEMVNSNGDWGYATILIEKKDLEEKEFNNSVSKWQQFFNDLRRRHLIPIVRIATKPDGDSWQKPNIEDAERWALFLDKLIWPTKNRYVVIYNEPNHAAEWGKTVDPASYAQVLNQTIDALKNKNQDFFVLNAGLDASAPHKPPIFLDEIEFLDQMNLSVPGIFNKLDGWVSHSYPNPGFVGLPTASGRGTVRTFGWELDHLKSLGVQKSLPVFITETGWKHREGETTDNSLPATETVANYYKDAFLGAWSGSRIVAVTPFLLDYKTPPFDHFSFKKNVDVALANKNGQSLYHPQYYALKDLPKIKGKPVQENKAELTQSNIFNSIVVGEPYNASLTIKNTGQSIWNETEPVKLIFSSKSDGLSLTELKIPEDQKIEPGKQYTFNFSIKALKSGLHEYKFTLVSGPESFTNKPFEFITEAKSPVILNIKAGLLWKKDFSGDYLLEAVATFSNNVASMLEKVVLNLDGKKQGIALHNLLPDYTYDFTLEKPYYKTKTIRQTVHSGENELDFGELQPDIPSAILHPQKLWQLLPFSN